MDGRFENEENVDMYREASDAKNTKKSTNTWVNAYNEWRDSRGYVEDLHQTDPVSLNERLKLFFAQLRKKNGEHYEPNCLKVMMAALDHRKNKLIVVALFVLMFNKKLFVEAFFVTRN